MKLLFFIFAAISSVGTSRLKGLQLGEVRHLDAGAVLTVKEETSEGHREGHSLKPSSNSGTIHEITEPEVHSGFYVSEDDIGNLQPGPVISAGASLKVHEPKTMPSPLTIHVLDTSSGSPAEGIHFRLYRQLPSESWALLEQGLTNNDGRYPNLMIKDDFFAGIYKIFFDTKAYFQKRQIQTFYPYVEIVFEVSNTTSHHHIPLILSPFGYTTYRGS